MYTLHVYVRVSLLTEIIVDKVGAVIEIQAQGKCQTLSGKLCIAPGGSNAECYNLGNDEMRLRELNYTYYGCRNVELCLRTTVRLAMNGTLYTVVCRRSLCGIPSTPFVGATTKLIAAGK